MQSIGRWAVILLMVAGLGSAVTRSVDAEEPLRVLFVGNSQIYTANLPAVFQAVADTAGRPIATEMLVKGGASLADRVSDGSVERALRSQRYDWVVLQERGGDALCHGPGRTRCEASSAAVDALVTVIRGASAQPVLLGTYQPHPTASRRLEEAEGSIAALWATPYVPVSEALRHGRELEPDLSWFGADGMHPGPDLALLTALLLHEEMFGEVPELGELWVNAPGYSPQARFFPPLLASEKSDPRGHAPFPRYSADTSRKVAAIARQQRR